MNIHRHLDELPMSSTPADLPQLPTARALWAQVRADHGLSADGSVPLLSAPDSNAKITKNEVPTYSLSLAPAVTSGHNVCNRSTPQCREACVMWTAGRGQMASVRNARRAKTHFLARYAYSFLALLEDELCKIERRWLNHADGDEVGWAVRLNVASDIRWERFPWLFDHQGMVAYDYTKWGCHERPNLPDNYRLTYSHNERWSDRDVANHIDDGDNVAMVFDCPKHQLPAVWEGPNATYDVIDGDLSDYRYGDPKGVIVGLAAKGAATKLETGGFVTAVTIN